MGDRTGIEWTDATWNPVRGCSRVSEGCSHRVGGRRNGWTGEVRLVPEHLADPLKWRKPRRIFVNSMSDLFHERLTNDQIAAVFGVMAACPQHTFQVLTKRPKRMREWFAWLETSVDRVATEWAGRDCTTSIHDACTDSLLEYLDETACAALVGNFDACHLGLTTSKTRRWPLPNVWLGVSVENQAAADERIPWLLATPAAVRFLSCEPLIGEIDLDMLRCDDVNHSEAEWGADDDDAQPWCHECDEERSSGHWLHCDGGIDWVIAGCESGPGARPCEVAWLRSLLDQCSEHEVPFFLKQAVEHHHNEGFPGEGVWSGDGSKRKAGGVIAAPYLDGVQHLEFPSAPPSEGGDVAVESDA